jgi:hypothetical protein
VVKDSVQEIAELLQTRYRGQSGIIYTTTIKETLDLVADLRALGLKVCFSCSNAMRSIPVPVPGQD